MSESKLIKFTREWVYDAESGKGYKVELTDKGEVAGRKEAFLVYYDASKRRYGYKKYEEVPVGILRKSVHMAKRYRDNTL